MSKRKGTITEQRAAKQLANEGWKVIRASSSGSAEREQPDLLAASEKYDHISIIAMEIRRTAGNVAYIDAEEAKALTNFAEAFGATPAIGARFDGDATVYVVPLTNARQTDGGNLAVDSDTPEAQMVTTIDTSR